MEWNAYTIGALVGVAVVSILLLIWRQSSKVRRAFSELQFENFAPLDPGTPQWEEMKGIYTKMLETEQKIRTQTTVKVDILRGLQNAVLGERHVDLDISGALVRRTRGGGLYLCDASVKIRRMGLHIDGSGSRGASGSDEFRNSTAVIVPVSLPFAGGVWIRTKHMSWIENAQSAISQNEGEIQEGLDIDFESFFRAYSIDGHLRTLPQNFQRALLEMREVFPFHDEKRNRRSYFVVHIGIFSDALVLSRDRLQQTSDFQKMAHAAEKLVEKLLRLGCF